MAAADGETLPAPLPVEFTDHITRAELVYHFRWLARVFTPIDPKAALLYRRMALRLIRGMP